MTHDVDMSIKVLRYFSCVESSNALGLAQLAEHNAICSKNMRCPIGVAKRLW